MTNDSLPPPPPESALAQHLLVMALGVAQTAVLCTAAQLGLADQLQDGPKSVAALAEATGTPPPTLARLLAVLAHLGLCTETAPGQFACTPLGALLQTAAPHSLRHFALLMGGSGLARRGRSSGTASAPAPVPLRTSGGCPPTRICSNILPRSPCSSRP
jgi:hypothetical protein